MSEHIVVKPLEWTPWTGSRAYAYSSIGEYSVDIDTDDEMSETPYVVWGFEDNIGHYSTLETAKVAAQADYSARILSAIAAPPAESNVEIERLREALRRMEDCFEQLASTRTHEIYLAMIDGGQGQALLDLDNARRNARDVLREGGNANR